MATDRLASGDANFAVDVPLKAAHWQFRARFQDPGQLVASSTRTVRGTVGARATAVVSRFSVRVGNGRVTVHATLLPKAGAGGSKVVLLALRTSGAAARYVTTAHTTARRGTRTVTLRGSLRRGYRWVLVLERTARGQATSYTPQVTVNVP